jgi:hypothetical protein
MPLMKASLSRDLADIFKRKPSSPPEAAVDWAKAYVAYGGSALSSAASLPVTAPANLPILIGAFTGAFQAQSPAGAAALMAQGVMGFWSAMAWVGPAAAGVTASPGNAALAAALSAVFADTSKKSEGDKANQIADAFDSGAKLVIVSDIPFAQPAPPIVAPIS